MLQLNKTSSLLRIVRKYYDTICTNTNEPFLSIHTCTAVETNSRTGTTLTIVDLRLAILSSESSQAITIESINDINTSRIVLAKVNRTLIDNIGAISAGITRQALASITNFLHRYK